MNRANFSTLSSLHLAKLNTFEVAARLGSFALAAEELCLTPSAVSHQIAKLERDLDILLFERKHRQIFLTPQGQQIYQTLTVSLAQIGNELMLVQKGSIAGVLTLYVRPSFAYGWLVPRLNDFIQQHPSIEVKLLTGNDNLDLTRHGIDLAIYYDHVAPTYAYSESLFEEQVVPVCSPSYARKMALGQDGASLEHCVLLHDNQAWHLDTHTNEWKSWQEHHRHVDLKSCRAIGFDRSDLAVHAAVNHAGIALGRVNLIQAELESEKLVFPLTPTPMPTGCRYYLLAEQKELTVKQRCFVDWIRKQITNG
tara:strand:- start:1710 stop:2636 length:927 start_codon:yes stop_codon:yes gene_type:complete